MCPDTIIVDLSMTSDDMHGFLTRMTIFENDREPLAVLVGDCWTDAMEREHFHVTGWWPCRNDDGCEETFALYQSDVDAAELMTDKTVIGVIHGHREDQTKGPSESDRVGRWVDHLNGVFVPYVSGWEIHWY